MSNEAMKLAQATLEAIATHCDLACVVTPDGAFYLQPAITALREALAEQPAQQKPVDKNGSPCPEFWDWLPKAYNFDGNGAFTKYNMEVAFLAGKQASQPAQQEPVDWEAVAADQAMTIAMMKAERKPWQGLTDEEVKAIFDSVPTASCQSYDHWRSLVARAIEAKLREKNT